ncbi:MAG: type I phosphomannose isomerase catalytic subunit [Planctomycetota bacterium]
MTELRLDHPLYLQPILMERVWGGNRLPALFGRPDTPGKVIGESWEVVDRSQAQSMVLNGAVPETSLRQLLERHPEQILGQSLAALKPARFPLLAKYIDASSALSIQVHPNNASAKGYDDSGKCECWVVVHAEPGARIVRGLQPGTTREQFEQALQQNQVEPLLHSFAAQVGDVVALPPGMVHALGAGTVVAEIQQNSDLTFRIHDYNRVDFNGHKRELHIEDALAVIRFAEHGDEFSGDMRADTATPLQRRRRAGVTTEHLLQGRYFDLYRYTLASGSHTVLEAAPAAPRILMVISGSGRLGRQTIKAGQTVLLSAVARALGVSAAKGMAGSLTLLVSSPTAAVC